MMRLCRFSVFLALLYSSGIVGHSYAQDKTKSLSAEDEKLLESLLRDFLFDPRGAERVEVTTRRASKWGDHPYPSFLNDLPIPA